VPIPSFEVDWRTYQAETQRLQTLLPSLPALPPAHRKLVAEIVMVRLFLLLENTIASAGAKMLCGANYLDSTQPKKLVSARSVIAAKALMRCYRRKRPRRYLSWTKSQDIQDNLSQALDPTDPFFTVIGKHGALLTEMRYVRNHIAHSNSGTRVNFRKVILQYYGGLKQGITPGLLLLTSALGPTIILERYIVSSRVVVRELLRA
jgi:hypothetical protein